MIGVIYGFDVCPTDANLLTSGGYDKKIKIYDRRESKIIKTFEGIHSGNIWLIINFAIYIILCIPISLEVIYCVRWSSSGDMLATASLDRSAKVIDFKTGKVVHSDTSSDGSKLFLFSINLYLSIMTRPCYICVFYLAKLHKEEIQLERVIEIIQA